MKGTVIETPVLLSVTYGLRRSEAMGLKWDAVNFEHQTLTIRHTVTGTGKNRVCEDRTKTKSSRRSLYLLPEVAAHLQEVRQKQAEMQALLKNQYHADGYICTWEDGRLISPEYLSRKFREILLEEHEKSGLPVYRYHDLRHSSASLLVGEGKSLKQVGEWLGHGGHENTQLTKLLDLRRLNKFSRGALCRVYWSDYLTGIFTPASRLR